MMKTLIRATLLFFITLSTVNSSAQNSVAHEWIDINLEAVRKDFARPTVHARNLWHISMAMYDAWAAYDSVATPYFLGNGMGDYDCPFDGVPAPADIKAAQEEALSFAAHGVIKHRYTGSPGQVNTFFILDTMMTHLGYDPSFTSTDYSSGIPAALGNYIAQQLIAAAMEDGANEGDQYGNLYYEPVNEDLVIDEAHFIGNPDIDSLNRWQPLGLTLFCDQGGNSFTTTPEFLSPEWGNVIPFSLADSVKSVKTRDGFEWTIFHDPGTPPKMAPEGDQQTDLYRWGFDLVAKWSSHLDPENPVMWDISPASIGNIPLDSLPDNFEDFPDFYDRDNGGDASQGHALNPHTNAPYDPQIVPRGDYARILAEFWADGPDSETPPGHWFDIYNEISEYPEFTWLWNGQDSLDHLEYDVKTYFTLGGGMHDAAIAAWSVKGYYDYIRPVSAIRAMAELGQSTSDTLPNYHPAGMKLEPGFIELVQLGDTLFDSDTIMTAGPEYVGELKMMCWLGPLTEDTCISGFAPQYQSEVGGVGWKLALDWWPYQRPTFVTPPFAGYVSGHSTFSRAAAEIMTYTTGDNYFPGGMGTFFCPQDNYLVFEDGPSMDIELQWATYQDASDQCSLSRIWGGIHPPADDIPGRKMGYEIGHTASDLAQFYFNGGAPVVESIAISDDVITDTDAGSTLTVELVFDQRMDVSTFPTINFGEDISSTLGTESAVWTDDYTLELSYTITDADQDNGHVSIALDAAKNFYGNDQVQFSLDSLLFLEMDNPAAVLTSNSSDPSFVILDLNFDENMDTGIAPNIAFPVEDPLADVMTFNAGFSDWITETHYSAVYDINLDVELHDIDVTVTVATDSIGNEMVAISEADFFSVDNLAPMVMSVLPSETIISDDETGLATFSIDILFNESMDTAIDPSISYPSDDPLANSLSGTGEWVDEFTFRLTYDVSDAEEELNDIDLLVADAVDSFGNIQSESLSTGLFSIDTKNPNYTASTLSTELINDALIGPDMVTIEVDFDEPMMTSIPAILTFPAENPGGALALSIPGSSWLDEDTYQWVFTVIDEDLALADVDIEIVAAIDLAGNPMVDTLLADAIDIEMENPEIADIEIDQTMVSDLDIGNMIQLGMRFSEPIDASITGTPTINYPEGDVSGTLMLTASDWIEEDSLALSFTVMDENLDFEDIDIEISGLVDTVGNTLESYLAVDVLSIDMLNPSVTNVILNTALIDNSFIGTNTFTIEAEFSEVLDQSFDPILIFPTEDPSSTLTFNAAASTWTSETSYVFGYDVIEGFTSLPDVDVRIEGGVDLAGNISFLQVEEDAFDIDIASSILEYGITGIQVFPNPVMQGAQLSMNFDEKALGEWTIEFIDPLGRVMRSESVNIPESTRIELSTDGLASGNYLLRVYGNAGISAFQIQVIR